VVTVWHINCPDATGKLSGSASSPKKGCGSFTVLGSGASPTEMAARLGLSLKTVNDVLRGRGHSTRVEDALYQTLGYPSFEAMIAASRGKEMS